MKKRSVIITIGTLVALIAGGGLAYWFLAQRTPGGGELPVGIDAVPDDVLMTISLSTDENQWAQLRRLGTNESQAQFNSFLDQWRDRLLTANDLSYAEDIQPWLGDQMTVALMGPTPLEGSTPEEGDTSEPQTPDAPPQDDPALELNPDLIDPTQEQAAVMFLPMADPLEAQSVLTQALEEGSSPVERDYRGITIQTFEGDGTETYEAMVLDRQMVVVATQANTLEAIVDTYKGDPSVADTSGYRQAAGTVAVSQPFAQIYINAAMTRAIAAANSTETAQARALAPLQTTEGIAATATVNSNGLHIQGVSWLQPDSDPLQLANQSRNPMAERLPSSTLIAISGSNLKQLWDGYSQRTAQVAEGPLAPKNLRTTTQNLFGLNLERDLMAWMDGEFSLALVSTSDEASNVPSAGLAFLVNASDRTLAKQTLTQLDEILSSRYRFQVTEAQQGGQEVVNWQSPFAALTITRGWLDDDVTFLAFNNVTKDMLPTPSSSLANLDLFRQAMANQPNESTGYFFVNLEEFVKARDQLPVPNFPQEQAALVNAIRAVGVTTSVEGDRQLRYDISVVTHTEEPTAQ